MSVGTQLQSVVLCTGRSTVATGITGALYKGEGSTCVPRNGLWGGVGCWIVDRYERFGTASRLHLQGTKSQPYYSHDVRPSKFKDS